VEDGVTPKAQASTSVETYKRMFEEFQSSAYDSRRESGIDRDYYDGYQWTAEERTVLRRRKQPDNVYNRVRPAVNGTLGIVQRGKTDPKAFPRNPQDEDSADVASKSLRYIADKNSFDETKIECFNDLLVEGTCAALVGVDANRDIPTDRIPWSEFIYDTRSKLKDFRDATWMGSAKWMFEADVKAIAGADPAKVKEITDTIEAGAPLSVDDSFEDRPEAVMWVDKGKRRLFVVEIYHKEGGVWRHCIFHSGGALVQEDSQYLDEFGKPTNPIVARSIYVDRKNNRMGIVRDMRGPQDEINKSRSKIQHYLNTRMVQEASPGAGMGSAEEARAEAARPDGALPSGWQIVPQNDVVNGRMEMLREAKSEIERMGPSPETLGRQNAEQSGRALLARQQAGMVEQGVIFGAIEDFEKRSYRAMWHRARQYWNAPMWVRVTDDEGSPEFIGVNQPKGPPIIDPATGQPQIDPKTKQPMEGEPVMDPTTGQPLFGLKNNIAQLDVDIDIDSTPDTANIQQEQFQILAELAKAYPQDVPFEDLLEVSAMPNKRALIEKRKARAEEASQAQQNNPQAALQIRGAEAEISEKENSAELKAAQTAKTVMETAGLAQEQMAPPPPQPIPAAGGF